MSSQILRIVVASPNDVKVEREIVEEVAEELNRGIAAVFGLRFEVIRWETDAFPGFHRQGPQALIDTRLRIEDSDLLVGIFWKRIGTPIHRANSGTEHEFQIAYQSWKTTGRPQIMVYFNQKPYMPSSKAETDQQGRVFEFKDTFPEEGLWWPYKGKFQFEKSVRNHLTQFILHRATLESAEAKSGSIEPETIVDSDFALARYVTTDEPLAVPRRCGGRRATILGTSRKDTIRGTLGPDVILGRGGNDTIRGLRGNDTICGGPVAIRSSGTKETPWRRGGRVEAVGCRWLTR